MIYGLLYLHVETVEGTRVGECSGVQLMEGWGGGGGGGGGGGLIVGEYLMWGLMVEGWRGVGKSTSYVSKHTLCGG